MRPERRSWQKWIRLAALLGIATCTTAAATSTASQADSFATMKADFERINLTVADVAIDGGKMTIRLQLKSGAGPLPCEKIWQQVNFAAFSNIDTVTIMDPSGNAGFNCTKFLSAAPSPQALSHGAPQDLPGA